jgi:ankyrin repeat protein
MVYPARVVVRTHEENLKNEASLQQTLREMEKDMEHDRVSDIKLLICSSHGFGAIGTKYLEAPRQFGKPQRTLTLMHIAAERGDIRMLECIRQQGVSVDVLDTEQKTPLYYAVCADQIRVAKFLVYHNANIYHTRGTFCNEPGELVYRALVKHQNEMVMFLLTCRSDMHFNYARKMVKNVDLQFNGESIVMIAAKLRNIDMIQFLNYKGVCLNVKDPTTGRNLATTMVLCGHKTMLEEFIQRGICLDHRDNSGLSCLHFATIIERRVPDTGLIETPNTSAPCTPGTKTYWLAQTNAQLVKILLAVRDPKTYVEMKGSDNRAGGVFIDRDPKDMRGLTPLHLAVSYNSYDVAVALIDAGANIEAECNRQMTPLLHAVSKNHMNIAKVLLSNGANIEACNEHGHRALCIASKKGYFGMVEMLLRLKASIIIDTDAMIHDTPLGLAVANDHMDVAQLLLQTCVDVNHVDEIGHTVLSDAVSRGWFDMVVVLLEKGASVIIPSHTRARILSREMDAAILKHGNITDSSRIRDLLVRLEEFLLSPFVEAEKIARLNIHAPSIPHYQQMPRAAKKFLAMSTQFRSNNTIHFMMTIKKQVDIGNNTPVSTLKLGPFATLQLERSVALECAKLVALKSEKSAARGLEKSVATELEESMAMELEESMATGLEESMAEESPDTFPSGSKFRLGKGDLKQVDYHQTKVDTGGVYYLTTTRLQCINPSMVPRADCKSTDVSESDESEIDAPTDASGSYHSIDAWMYESDVEVSEAENSTCQ